MYSRLSNSPFTSSSTNNFAKSINFVKWKKLFSWLLLTILSGFAVDTISCSLLTINLMMWSEVKYFSSYKFFLAGNRMLLNQEITWTCNSHQHAPYFMQIIKQILNLDCFFSNRKLKCRNISFRLNHTEL